MKNIIIAIFFAMATLGAFFTPGFAAQKNQTTISYVTINGAQSYDIEIMLDKSNVLLGIKQFADILGVPVQSNHSTKEITFTVKENSIKVTKEDIFINGKKINAQQNIYLKAGMMDEVRDEIFSSEKTLSEIFGVQILTDKNDLSAKIITDEKIITNIEDMKVEQKEELPYKAYTDIVVPNPKKKITFDTLEFNNSLMTDGAKQIYQNSQTSNYMFNNNSQFSLKGSAYGGAYSLDFNTSNYAQKMFSFGGLSFKYKNKFNGVDYELGKVTGFKDDNYSIGTMLLGAQLYDYDPTEANYRSIEGTVEQTSVVNLYVDDKFHSTLSTYKGIYSLRDVYLNCNPRKIMLEELKADGTKSEILTKDYPKYDGFLLEKQKRTSMFAGVSGFNDRLFAQNGYIYQMKTKKFVVGAQREYGISDKLFYDSKFVYDKILSMDDSSIWGQNYYNNNSILSMGTYRNPNSLEGFTMINSLDYFVNDNWKLGLVGAISSSTDKALSYQEQNPIGYSLALNSQYKKDKFTLDTSIYNQSPNFYLAGSESGFISDRLGAKISGTYRWSNFSLTGSYNKYFSNLDNKYGAGVTGFDEVSLGLYGRIPKVAQVRLSGNLRQGQNSIGKMLNYYYDLNVSRNFGSKLNVEAGVQASNYQTQYTDASKTGFNSLFSTIYTKANIQMPKNAGTLTLGHDIVSIKNNDIANDYRMMNFGYTFPEFKRFILSCGLGFKYEGAEKGLNYRFGLGYRLKSGTVMSLNYQYNQNAGYLIDNMYIPTSARHSINFTYNDTYAVMPNGLKSIGYTDATKGFVDIVTYLDKNKNSKYDEVEDVLVENVPIKTTWSNDDIYTKKRGSVESIDKGVYKIGLDSEKLMATLSSPKGSKENQLIVVNPKQTTKVEFPLISSVGNITGKLKLIDDFGRNLKIEDFIVVLNDESGLEAAYSTVDKDGNYYFSGIAPGNYIAKLDQSFIDNNNLQAFENKGEKKVEIPYVYKEFVDIKNDDLIYKSW